MIILTMQRQHALLFLNSFILEISIYINQSTDLQSKPMDWFLYDRDGYHVDPYLYNFIFN